MLVRCCSGDGQGHSDSGEFGPFPQPQDFLRYLRLGLSSVLNSRGYLDEMPDLASGENLPPDYLDEMPRPLPICHGRCLLLPRL